jgi:hypothetical protein
MLRILAEARAEAVEAAAWHDRENSAIIKILQQQSIASRLHCLDCRGLQCNSFLRRSIPGREIVVGNQR